MDVLHSCPNLDCVNPAHLYLGTPKEVALRRDLGGKNGMAKLTIDQIIVIRNDPRPQTVIAKEHRVSQANISRIKSKKQWRCV